MRSHFIDVPISGCTASAISYARSSAVALLLSGIASIALTMTTLPVSAQEVTQIAKDLISGEAGIAKIADRGGTVLIQPVALPTFSDAVMRRALRSKLVVVGFVGGRIRADDAAHREVRLSRSLQEDHGSFLDSYVFANRDGNHALKTILKTLDRDQDGVLSTTEKRDARIVLYGHSWGASQAVTLARRLNQLEIPVLLTIQVDSVQKPGQNDRIIPANVRYAVNFYQAEGLLRGRSRIVAANPQRTSILGNFQMSYRNRSISCSGYPWYAQLFMHRHIQIENDPAVWGRVEDLIVERIGSSL